jgi:hypothetical protein
MHEDEKYMVKILAVAETKEVFKQGGMSISRAL